MKRLALATAIVVGTLVAVALAWRLRGVVLIFFASLATAAAIRPVAEWFARRHLNWTAALAIAYVSIGSSLCLLIAASAGPLAIDLEQLSQDLGLLYERVKTLWPQGSPIQQAAARHLPVWDADAQPSLRGSDLNGGLIGFTLGAVETVINVTLVVVLSVYWSFDRVYFERLWLSVLAVERRSAARDIWRAVEHETGAYLRSEVVQCAAAGLLLNVGFRMLGHPYPALMALVVALAWLIPWIGAVFAVAIVVAASMLSATLQGGPGLWALALPASAWTIAVLSFLEFVIEPYLFNRKRYNALWVVLVLVGLTDWLGPIGLLLGPPLAAALQIVGSYVLNQRQQAVIDQTEPTDSFRQRLRKLQISLAAMGDSRPQVKSLLDRLSTLIDDVNATPEAAASTIAPSR